MRTDYTLSGLTPLSSMTVLDCATGNRSFRRRYLAVLCDLPLVIQDGMLGWRRLNGEIYWAFNEELVFQQLRVPAEGFPAFGPFFDWACDTTIPTHRRTEWSAFLHGRRLDRERRNLFVTSEHQAPSSVYDPHCWDTISFMVFHRRLEIEEINIGERPSPKAEGPVLRNISTT